MNSFNIKADDSVLSRLDRAFFRLESALNVLAGLVILAVMLLSVANILMRKLLNYPIPGFIDLMVMAVPFMAFLGLSNCQRLGGHIRMDILIGNLKRRPLWFAELLSILLMIVVCAVLIYGSGTHAERAIRMGDSTPVAGFATWPVKAAVTMAFILLMIRLTLQFMVYLRAGVRNDTAPAGVPYILSAAEQAERESESMTSEKEVCA